MKTSEYLEICRSYTRSELKDSFDITDETIKTGIFRPKGHASVWLFISQESSQPDYNNEIVGTRLQFSGQSAHRYDDDIVEHRESGLEIIVFFRQKGRGPFVYCGRAEYVSHQEDLNGPTRFIAELLDAKRDEISGEFQPLSPQDVVKEHVRFVADTHLIQVLGEQLIGSEKVGILELIKNAYDANATHCAVWIEKVPGLPDAPLSDPQIASLPGPVITIIDNGFGMNERALKEGWLRPATRIKTSAKERMKQERRKADERETRSEYEQLVKALKEEYGGRLPLGEKGVGRFATHRLGRNLIVQTKTKNEPYEWMLEINWDDFNAFDDKPRDLHKIPLTLTRREPTYHYGLTNSGTLLRIYGGKDGFTWGKETLRDIGQEIRLLRSPAKKPTGFVVEFHCPQLSETFEPLTDTVPAPFLCLAIVDEEGRAEIDIRFAPPSSLSKPLPLQTWTSTVDLRARVPDHFKGSAKGQPLRRPECGPFYVEIKCWIRTPEWIDYADWKQFSDYLDKFGGIGVYRDGLSILPAQVASKDDWLGLANRHIKKGQNISYYQIWGGIDILQEQTLGLIDRTSREGMLETTAFKDLRELVKPIVYELENHVQYTRDRYTILKQGERIPETTLNKQGRIASRVFEEISTKYDFESDPFGLTDAVGISGGLKEALGAVAVSFDQLRREVRELRTQSDALLEAAGYGIAISVAIHEIEKITSNLYFGLDHLAKKLTALDYETQVELDQLKNTSQALLNELKRIAPLRVTRLEQQRTFKLQDAILAARGAFRLAWKELNVHFYQPTSDDLQITGSFGACSQVFANLFDNSTYWLKSIDNDERRITVHIDSMKRRIVVADSGPGVAEQIRPYLFEPFYSLKSPPSGLGLYICRYYMHQMKGTIRESLESEKIPGFSGAHFTLMFKETSKE